jgi:FtsP/CotA-like multicopper oxidase with cupredoxin domain
MARVRPAILVSFAGCLLASLLALAATGARADQLTFDLRLERGRAPADMRLIRVKQGDTIKLRFKSDRPMTLHLHGYDIEQKVEPDKVAEMTFVARATGRFSVEVHHPRQGGGHTHGAPVVQIEVYPR